jgi:hypothetical protein
LHLCPAFAKEHKCRKLAKNKCRLEHTPGTRHNLRALQKAMEVQKLESLLPTIKVVLDLITFCLDEEEEEQEEEEESGW